MRKTKVSKRILSILLAALMVITSVPLMAFTAFGDDITDKLEAAMSNYVQAINDISKDTTNVYTSMKPAYDAYVTAQKNLDSYKYGGLDNGASAAADALNTAVDAMKNSATPLTAYKASAVPTMAGSTVPAYYYSNLLSSPDCTTSNRPIDDDNYEGLRSSVYYAPTVMLYDGVNESAMPVLANYQRSKTLTLSNKIYVYAYYPSNVYSDTYANGIGETDERMTPNTSFVLAGAENVGKSNRNWKTAASNVTNFEYINNNSDGNIMGTNNNNVYVSDERSTFGRGTGNSGWVGAINKMTYTPDSTFVNETSHTYKLNWIRVHAYNNDLFRQFHHTTRDTCTITVVNYSKVREALGKLNATVAAFDVTKYKEGGLADLFAAADAITAVKPAEAYSGGAPLDNLITTIEGLQNNQLPKLTAAYTQDSEDYQKLRNLLDDNGVDDSGVAVVGVTKTHTTGNASGQYTSDSWYTFDQKYQKAQRVFASVVGNGYTGAPNEAQTELIDAFRGLTTVVAKVDTTDLESLINSTQALAQPTIFTQESVDAVVAVIKAAKIAVWKDEANYGVATEKPDDSSEAQALVQAQIDAINEAVKGLRFTTAYEVSTELGSASLKELFDEYPSLKANEKDYVGFTEYEAAYNEVKAYADTLPTTEFTDFYAQSDEYTAMLAYLLEARQNLHITFLRAPDGTYIQNATLSALTKNNLQAEGVDTMYYGASIRYPQNAVLFKTTHDAKDLKYGEAVMTWEARQKDYSQVLDSITFHDDTSVPEGYTPLQWYNEFHSKTWVAIGYGDDKLDADDRLHYTPGDLTGSDAEMTNIKITGRQNVPLGTQYATEAGTSINTPDDSRITSLVANTEGDVRDEVVSGIVCRSTGENTTGVVTYTGDMVAHVAATPEYTTFEEMPAPYVNDARVAASYGIYGNVGFLYRWKTSAAGGFSMILGYSYLTCGTIDSSCYVVDISYLIDLIDMVADTPAAPYTEESYQAFKTALDEAKADYRYEEVVSQAANTRVGANNVAWNLTGKYNNLYNAYAALEYKPINVNFVYKDANGAEQTSTIVATYDEVLSKYQNEIADIMTPAYNEGIYKYTFSGWSPEINLNDVLHEDVTYTAQYDATELPADWTDYNAAKAELLASLADKKFTADDLQKVQNTINSAMYFENSTHLPSIMASAQPIIDAEAATYRAAIPTAPAVDISVADSIEKAKATTDKDQYDVSVLDSFNLYKSVVVNGTSYDGLLFSTQGELDKAVEDVLNQLTASASEYDVYLNGTKVNDTKIPFGTSVVVNANGTIDVNSTDINKDAELDFVAWYYRYSAPSTNGQETADKFMTTSPSLGFIVKGNTYLTTKPVQESDQGYAVKFVRGTDNKVFDVIYTDANGNFTVPSAPKLAYYSFSGYSVDGVTAGETFTVSADTTIVANYTPQTENKYTVNILHRSFAWDPADPEQVISSAEYGYNERVDITSQYFIDNEFAYDETYVWCEVLSFDPETYAGIYVPVYYGPNYSFYVCKDVNICGFTKEEFDALIADEELGDMGDYADELVRVGTSGELYGVTVEDGFVKVLDNSGNLAKVSMIGTFVLPEGYKMVETGMLLGPVGSSLQLENTGVDGIRRAKSTKHTPGNQFVLSLNVNDSNMGQTYSYAAYAIVELPDGTRTTFYSDTRTNVVTK